MYKTLSTALAALSLVSAQQVGTNTAEVHPALSVQSCTKSGGCTTLQRSIVLDANWRWLHSTSGYTNCYTGQSWDSTLCPDAKTCAQNCAVDGADYSGTYGISTSGNAATLGFVTQGSSGANIGSRVYLMQDASTYQSFNLLNGEFTFDVDVTALPCGLNGALYFSQMDADGGMAKAATNKAGAKYGTGYCDAQCPKDLKFINGLANNVGWTGSSNDANSGAGVTGTCCDEMDIWEANSQATAFTPHPCSSVGLSACTGTACSTTCDQAGCDFNSWRMGNQTFYGPGLTVDTKSKITVVTQFITDDNTKTGNLVRINRFYVQNNKLIPNSYSEFTGIDSTNAITDSFCAQQKSVFGDNNDTATKGGLKKMGDAFKRGMVLVMSIWDDHVANALWLDSDYPVGADPSKPGVNRGPCSTSSGVPSDVETNAANSKVTYSNIKWGDLNSTFTYTGVVGGGGGGGGTPPVSSVKPTSTPVTIKTSSTSVKTTTTSVKTSTTSIKTTTTSAAPAQPTGTVPKYGQCGGKNYVGSTVCAAGSTCKVTNEYYSQCL